ncbi:MAG: hypothetical protein Q8N05_13710 [Bacteroidota bacterium]|nr:hypothetical protein [Bacteroidota bacterium]
MEAIYKLKANEINPNLMGTIKKLFGSKEITITITTETDETEYLTSNPVNKKQLLDAIKEVKKNKNLIRFTGKGVRQNSLFSVFS